MGSSFCFEPLYYGFHESELVLLLQSRGVTPLQLLVKLWNLPPEHVKSAVEELERGVSDVLESFIAGEEEVKHA